MSPASNGQRSARTKRPDRHLPGHACQLRAARIFAAVTREELAALAEISVSTLAMLETSGAVDAKPKAYKKLKLALERLGVTLIDDKEVSRDGGPGVRAI